MGVPKKYSPDSHVLITSTYLPPPPLCRVPLPSDHGVRAPRSGVSSDLMMK